MTETIDEMCEKIAWISLSVLVHLDHLRISGYNHTNENEPLII